MKLILTVASLLIILIINPALAQTKIENLSVKSYIINCSVKAQKNDAAKPSFHTIIQLEGEPVTGSNIKKMILNFYLDDRGTSFRPSYDQASKTAYGHYPMSEYDKIYQLLKHTRNQMSAMFIDSSTNTTEIMLGATGKLPLKY